MKQQFLVSFLCFFLFVSFNTEINALEQSAKSCSSEDIQFAVNQVIEAGRGIVHIPEGKADLDNIIRFRLDPGESLEIIGSGIDKTTLNNNAIARHFEQTSLGGAFVRFSGINFTSDPNGNGKEAISLRGPENFHVDNCMFNGRWNRIVVIYKTEKGLIDHCKFINTIEPRGYCGLTPRSLYQPDAGNYFCEIYENTYTYTGNENQKGRMITMNAGGVVYNNTFNNVTMAGNIFTFYDGPYFGYKYPEYTIANNLHIWNNKYNNCTYSDDMVSTQSCGHSWQIVCTYSVTCDDGGVTGHLPLNEGDEILMREPQPGDLLYPYKPYRYPHPLADTDKTSPSSINLSIAKVSYNSAELTWTAPGDDDSTGTATYYDMRYAPLAITDDNWDSATQVIGEPSPSLGGTQEVFTIKGLDPDSTYNVAIKAFDEMGNVSPLSNIITFKTGNIYYVSKDGIDLNSGTEAEPWLTIQKAASTLQAGDAVYIKEGVYNEQVNVQNSGTSGKFISYLAYPGHVPAIDGQNSGTIFSIVGKEHIIIDGLEIKNAGLWGILVENSTNIEIKNAKVSYSNNGENIQIRGRSSFILIEGCEVSYAQKWSGIDIYQYNGRPHHVTVRKCIVHHNENFAGIASEQADNLVIENNTCYNNSLGIDIGSGDNNIIRYNKVYDCATGIALSSNEDSQVYNNKIYNIIDEAIYSYYWVGHGEAHSRNKWYNNIIYNTGFGIYESVRKTINHDMGPSTDHEYYKNIFYNIGSHGGYRIPLYFHGSTGIRFYNNTIYMNKNYDALQFIDGAINSEIKNNIISISGNKFALKMEDISYTTSKVDYNCYHNRNGSSIILWSDGTDITNYTKSQINDKTFYNNTRQGGHSISADPIFVDPVNNFQLQEGSPCIDAGDPTYSVPAGGGLRIDMGACEYGVYIHYHHLKNWKLNQ